MPKLKTKSSIKKRFARTATGKIKFKPAGKRHGMSKRSNKFIRNTKKTSSVVFLSQPQTRNTSKHNFNIYCYSANRKTVSVQKNQALWLLVILH